MIKVFVKRNKDKCITEISATGHANYQEHGKDIVCAAVSTLFQSTLIGLTEVAKTEVEYKISDAYMLIKPRNNNQLINALLDTLDLSLDVISQDYPKYLNVTRGGARDDKN